jgi:hypothetical protein
MTFDEFAGARLPVVLRFATALAGDPDLAKDLVQEVLIRVSGRWQEIGQLDRPEAYIRKMVVNEYLSWRRRSWRLIPSGMSGHLPGRLSPDPADGYRHGADHLSACGLRCGRLECQRHFHRARRRGLVVLWPHLRQDHKRGRLVGARSQGSAGPGQQMRVTHCELRR